MADKTTPNLYSDLLQSACSGHALWSPRKTMADGGALGDVGYIDHGSFYKAFNIYDNPPPNVQRLQMPMNGIYRDEDFHMPIMQSSTCSTVSFQVTADATLAPLPLRTVSVEPRFTLQREQLAFLAPPTPTVQDTISPVHLPAIRSWIIANRDNLDPKLVVLTHVVRSSGWVGGIVTGRKATASLDVDSALGVGVNASMEYEVTGRSLTQGPRPTEWSALHPQYSIIVRFTAIRTRIQRKLLRFKLALTQGKPASSYIAPARPGKAPNSISSGALVGSSLDRDNTDVEAQDSNSSTSDREDGSCSDDAWDDEDNGRDRNLLDSILDMVLDANEGLDFAVADSSILVDFSKKYAAMPCADPARVRPIFNVETVAPSQSNECLTVAFVTSLSCITDQGHWLHDRTLRNAAAVPSRLPQTNDLTESCDTDGQDIQVPFREEDITATATVHLVRKMASNGYSAFYMGRLALGGNDMSTQVAVKRLHYPARDPTEATIQDVKNRMDLWNNLDHPNVLQFPGNYLLDEAKIRPGAVSLWCDDVTIIEYLKSAHDERMKRADGPIENGSFALLCLEVELLSQVADGLEYLHVHNIIHGDLQGCNILVREGVARLCNFGDSDLVAGRLGNTSVRWLAPEFLESGARTREGDIWALGCVVLEVSTLQVPFHDREDLAVHSALKGGNLPYTYRRSMNMKLWRIAEECWSRHLSDRPTLRVVRTRLRDILSPLRTLDDTFTLASGLPLPEVTAASVLSAVSETGSDLKLDFIRVRDVIEALVYLGDRYYAAVVRSAARGQQLMTNLSSPELPSPLLSDDAITTVAFLPDDRRLVPSSYYTPLRVFDIGTGKTMMGPLMGHSIVCHVAVHGSHIASCSDDGTFRIVDADSGELVLGPISAHGKWFNWVAYSRDGSHIATAGQDHRAVLWDAHTGVQVRELVGHAAPVRCVVFSEDGTHLVSGSQDGTVRIWDVSSGECIGGIAMWDTETGAAIPTPFGHDEQVLALAFSPDGRKIASASEDKTIALWEDAWKHARYDIDGEDV